MTKQDYGYAWMFATPDDLEEHIKRFESAFYKEDLARYYTAIYCTCNFYATMLEKKDTEIDELKERLSKILDVHPEIEE